MKMPLSPVPPAANRAGPPVEWQVSIVGERAVESETARDGSTINIGIKRMTKVRISNFGIGITKFMLI